MPGGFLLFLSEAILNFIGNGLGFISYFDKTAGIFARNPLIQEMLPDLQFSNARTLFQ